MKPTKNTLKLLTGAAIVASLLALGACGQKEQQAAAPQEAAVEQE